MPNRWLASRVRFLHAAFGLVVLALSRPVEAIDSGEKTGAKRGGTRATAAVAVSHATARPLVKGAVTADWPRFLGPNHNSTTPETGLEKHFGSDGPTLLWEMSSGSGYAAPSIVGDRLVFFHRVGDEAVVDCLRPETGQRLWRFSYAMSYRDRYGFGNGPRCSPVIDGDLVFTYGADGQLHCLDLKTGKQIWYRDILGEFKVGQQFFGVSSTPLVEDEILIVNVGAPGGPCVVGFDKRTGEIRWTAGDQWGPGAASPVPATLRGQRRVLVLAGGVSEPPTGGLLSIDPRDGAIDLRFPFRGKRYESVNATSPLAVGNDVFITTSYRTGGVLVSAVGKRIWKTTALEAQCTAPIHRDGYLYGITGSGKAEAAIVCADAKSGKLIWSEQPEWTERVELNGKIRELTYTPARGSLIFADGAFLCLGESGHLAWFDLSPSGLVEISRARLFLAEESWTPPALSRGLLFVTQNKKDLITGVGQRLVCYDMRAAN